MSEDPKPAQDTDDVEAHGLTGSDEPGKHFRGESEPGKHFRTEDEEDVEAHTMFKGMKEPADSEKHFS